MNSIMFVILFSWATVALIMLLVWVWATRIKNAGVVDIFWAFNFFVLGLIIWLLADGYQARKNIVFVLVTLWSLRLGFYLLKRVGSHLKEEEGRYKQLRSEWAPNTNLKFFIFFQMQSFSNVFLAIPFFIISFNKAPQISVIEYIGAGLWLIAICGEGLADWQLQQFKKNVFNKGKVCQDGLWNYSRHPNYFFQLLIWASVLIFALASPYGVIAVVCPLSIGYLIFKVTGIPMTEKQSIRSKGDAYLNYQKTTNVFVPWFKKGTSK